MINSELLQRNCICQAVQVYNVSDYMNINVAHLTFSGWWLLQCSKVKLQQCTAYSTNHAQYNFMAAIMVTPQESNFLVDVVDLMRVHTNRYFDSKR